MKLRTAVPCVVWALALGTALSCSDDGADEGGTGPRGAGGSGGSSVSAAGTSGGVSGTSGAASSATAGVVGTVVGAAGNVSNAGNGGDGSSAGDGGDGSHAGDGGDGSNAGDGANAGRGGSNSNAGSSGTDIRDAGTAPAGDGPLDCDPKLLRCRIAELPCPEGQVHQRVDGCYGPCVPVDRCMCDGPDDCPHEEQYTCHMFRERCGPYL